MLADAGRNDEARAAALEAQRFAGADRPVLLVAASVLEDARRRPTRRSRRTPWLSPARPRSPIRSSGRKATSAARTTSRSSATRSSRSVPARRATSSPTYGERRAFAEQADNCPTLERRLRRDRHRATRRTCAGASSSLRYRWRSTTTRPRTTSCSTSRRQPDQARATRRAMGEWYAAQGGLTRARGNVGARRSARRRGVAPAARPELSRRPGAGGGRRPLCERWRRAFRAARGRTPSAGSTSA